MKLSVGGKKFGEVPDESVKPVGHKPLRHTVVDEAIVESIEKLIRRYLHRPGARDKFLRALGVQERVEDERQDKRDGDALPKGKKPGRKPSSPKRAVHRRPPKDFGDRDF
jgi:hypothetical protein